MTDAVPAWHCFIILVRFAPCRVVASVGVSGWEQSCPLATCSMWRDWREAVIRSISWFVTCRARRVN